MSHKERPSQGRTSGSRIPIARNGALFLSSMSEKSLSQLNMLSKADNGFAGGWPRRLGRLVSAN
jgi:hypothetical protein